MIDSLHSPHFRFLGDLDPPYLSTMSRAAVFVFDTATTAAPTQQSCLAHIALCLYVSQ